MEWMFALLSFHDDRTAAELEPIEVSLSFSIQLDELIITH